MKNKIIRFSTSNFQNVGDILLYIIKNSKFDLKNNIVQDAMQLYLNKYGVETFAQHERLNQLISVKKYQGKVFYSLKSNPDSVFCIEKFTTEHSLI